MAFCPVCQYEKYIKKDQNEQRENIQDAAGQ